MGRKPGHRIAGRLGVAGLQETLSAAALERDATTMKKMCPNKKTSVTTRFCVFGCVLLLTSYSGHHRAVFRFPSSCNFVEPLVILPLHLKSDGYLPQVIL